MTAFAHPLSLPRKYTVARLTLAVPHYPHACLQSSLFAQHYQQFQPSLQQQ